MDIRRVKIEDANLNWNSQKQLHEDLVEVTQPASFNFELTRFTFAARTGCVISRIAKISCTVRVSNITNWFVLCTWLCLTASADTISANALSCTSRMSNTSPLSYVSPPPEMVTRSSTKGLPCDFTNGLFYHIPLNNPCE